MVAKSFQSFEMLGEPYEENDRMYVKVRNPATGNIRQARWYTAMEYLAQYPEDEELVRKQDKYYKTQKEVLGFNASFIYIFSSNITEDHDWFRMNCGYLTRHWGWYFAGDTELPTDLPEEAEVYRLRWEDVGNDNGNLKDEDTVRFAVATLRNETAETKAVSQFIGSIGERLDLNLEVISMVKENAYKGFSAEHIFIDADGNQYFWKTSAKCWDVGTTKCIRGTVKEHTYINHVPTTVLTRCVEQKTK